MKLVYRLLTAVLTAVFVLSCGGDPEPRAPAGPVQAEEPVGPVETPVQESAGVPKEPQSSAETFDPNSITKEEFDTTKVEVQHLIQKLNDIIRAKNYASWVSYLEEDYFRLISSREYLDQINRTDRMRKANLVLRNARDYFNNVVVPSRANDRVDDIEFISQNRVKAYTISQKGERLRLYDLEKTNEGWKIIN
ncbi:MAG: hypothetical protein LBP69_07170 [Treponema sp.]|jgi:hypothetical protein|nr:hypothetical protein [Treponema sp.]